MALDAGVSDRRIIEHLGELCSMGTMATGATDSKILVAWVTCFFTNGVGRVLAPVMAIQAQLILIFFFGEKQIIRSMGVMTTGTFPLHNRLMLTGGLALSFNGISMATAA